MSDLNDLTRIALAKKAKNMGLKKFYHLNKEQLIELIKNPDRKSVV